jgi:predicted nucleic acid-binding protein
MRYVLDASVAIKWVLPEVDQDRATLVRERARRGDLELIAPDHFPVEVAHALTKAQRRGLIRDPEVWCRLSDVLRYGPELHPSLPLLFPATAIAVAARIGVHDCLYVALAEREGCELLTADDRLRRNLPGRPIMLLSGVS